VEGRDGVTAKKKQASAKTLAEQAEGGLKNTKEIANALSIKSGTVRNYVSMILDKLEVKNRIVRAFAISFVFFPSATSSSTSFSRSVSGFSSL
jgi:hypothetical protein